MKSPEKMVTYAEAGKLLGIKTESVRRRAIARGWKRTTGNDGLARVLIPDTALNTKRKRKSASNRDQNITGDYRPDEIRNLQKSLDDVKEQLSAEKIRNSVLEERISGFEIRIEDAQTRTDEIRTERDHWRDLATRPQPSLFERIRTSIFKTEN